MRVCKTPRKCLKIPPRSNLVLVVLRIEEIRSYPHTPESANHTSTKHQSTKPQLTNYTQPHLVSPLPDPISLMLKSPFRPLLRSPEMKFLVRGILRHKRSKDVSMLPRLRRRARRAVRHDFGVMGHLRDITRRSRITGRQGETCGDPVAELAIRWIVLQNNQ